MNGLKVKVLIIDDEKAILGMLSQRLCRIGFVVDVAETAEVGINKINSSSYDIIFTDIRMPGMSGDDVFKYIKTNVKKSIPVIAMSGTPWLLENSSFDAVITKPFSKEELMETINQFVQIGQPESIG
jgi:DNA-binding response OmpR family regulator